MVADLISLLYPSLASILEMFVECAAHIDQFTELVHNGVLYFFEASRLIFRLWIAKFWLELKGKNSLDLFPVRANFAFIFITETVAMHCNGRTHCVCL